MRQRLSPLVLLLALVTAAWAQTGQQVVEFGGVTFQPKIHEIEGRPHYSATDPEVARLIHRANVTAQWSSSGNTLFVFAPGRESYWTAGSAQARVNGRDIPAPGRITVENGQTYIEPSALFYALATQGVPKQNGYHLHPVVTEVVAEENGYLLRSPVKARPKASHSEQVTQLTLEGFAWDGPSDLVLGTTHFRFSGGADKERPLTIEIQAQPFQQAKLAGSTLLNETRIQIHPHFPGSEQGREVALKSLTAEQHNGLDMLVFEFDAGTKMHYWQDLDQQVLRLLIPRGQALDEAFSDKSWPGLKMRTLATPLYPVLEITVPLSQAGFELVQLEQAPTSLALMRGPKSQLTPLAAQGVIETPGWANIRGTIVIDPGHGGSDPGCVNRALGTREADVTLAISLHLAEVLRAQGWNVVLTRETDRDVTYAGSPDVMELEARSGIANEIGADLFMSIHCNASVNSQAAGTSIHWWKAEDYEFAQSLEHVLGPAIGLGQKGLIRDRFVVLRHAKMPSVLVETAFLSNAYEASKLSDPNFQKVIAQQLAGGLASYMQGRYASRGGVRAVD